MIVVEANYDVGGHAIISGGHMALGGGTSAQKKYDIPDSPDTVFSDLTDWSVVQPNGTADFRYNDRALMRAFADHCAIAFEFLLENGVEFADKAPDNQGASTLGNSALRENHAIWTKGAGLESPNAANGTAVMRPLEASARRKGVKFLLNYKMTNIVREPSLDGRVGHVIGITAQYNPHIMPGLDRAAEKFPHRWQHRRYPSRHGTARAQGSHRRHRRQHEPYRVSPHVRPALDRGNPVGGEPYSYQDASGELAGMAVGAALWGLNHQALENGATMRAQRALATKYNYTTWKLESPIFPLVKSTGFNVKDWQNLILVNQVGRRFYDETKGDPPHGNNGHQVPDYLPNDHRNTAKLGYTPHKYNFVHAALAMNEYSEPPDYPAGPQWAIFDADAVEREGWKVVPPYVDPDGYFFSANTIPELAAAIKNEYQAKPMNGEILQATVERYNSFVDKGVDEDFGKPVTKYKIHKPPFYAAWGTVIVHDTRSGLRINGRCQVIDMNGQVIPGLYCAGESAGGFNQHGMGRCVTQGYICGTDAAKLPKR